MRLFRGENLLIGNIENTTWKEALASKTCQEFGSRKAELNQQCLTRSFWAIASILPKKNSNPGTQPTMSMR